MTNGFVVRNGDTINCTIYLPQGGINDDCYLYVRAKNKKDSNVLYTPKDIDCYFAMGVLMISHASVSGSDTSYFFMKQLVSGKVMLYQKVSIPSNTEFRYYFRKLGSNDFLFFTPYQKSVMYLQESFKSGGMVSKYNSQNDEQFLKTFAEYLKECPGVHNKLLTGFYTTNDIESIIRDYNSCKK
jgi:hypothetical protein